MRVLCQCFIDHIDNALDKNRALDNKMDNIFNKKEFKPNNTKKRHRKRKKKKRGTKIERLLRKLD